MTASAAFALPLSEHIALLTLIVLGAVVAYVQFVTRRRKDYREVIEPMLQRAGYRFLCVKTPRLFDVGPFPKFEWKPQSLQTETPIGRGEYNQYRIVYASTTDGEKKQFWVRLEFVAFKFENAEWIPKLE